MGDSPSVPPCAMTIFGVSGDLTKRLLLPSLYNLATTKTLPDEFQLVGVARQDWDDAAFRNHIVESIQTFWGKDASRDTMDWLSQRATYVRGDFDQDGTFDALKAKITELEKSGQTQGNRMFYLAVAPEFISTMAAQLSRTGLLTEEDGKWRRLVIEKPFGHDLSSAVALNRELQKNLREDQIYRIDHFAGKDAVQDLVVFRFSNSIFEPLWNRGTIDNVQITAAETVGVEGRAGYYETSGALRDMMPNHMAEMLSLIAMEPPVSFDAEHMRRRQVDLLQSIRAIASEEVGKYAVRGQYGAGTTIGAAVPGYRAEPKVNPASITETYAAMQVEVDNWRWSGVPFYLRTGKRLTQARTEIVVTFKQPPARLFPVDQLNPNQVIFNLQPEQRIRIQFGSKAPGLKTKVEQGLLDFNFPAGPFEDHGKGYERLLHDVMLGDATLFQSSEFVEAGWRMVQPLLDAWGAPPKEGFPNYAAGSAGPAASDAMLGMTGHAWDSLAVNG